MRISPAQQFAGQFLWRILLPGPKNFIDWEQTTEWSRSDRWWDDSLTRRRVFHLASTQKHKSVQSLEGSLKKQKKWCCTIFGRFFIIINFILLLLQEKLEDEEVNGSAPIAQKRAERPWKWTITDCVSHRDEYDILLMLILYSNQNKRALRLQTSWSSLSKVAPTSTCQNKLHTSASCCSRVTSKREIQLFFFFVIIIIIINHKYSLPRQILGERK